ncbi:ribose 5-phosphate isomerase B [Thalassobaculum fulvum]|jgi:ribose 5-phosphate isomerase B|uniref:Ribose 5-phosphate isomerase B n=1 Tax=Thalassobaculum fulvum TaxID=1633335 RepID=A0A918XR00_9PROT|nr:ribose 5-phosphate isomerase B [Thalassobaculum fulvum]GHD47652.1 ribose 5-phosphate isomerase B [Thalassobaculum fulvum]
MTQEVIALASDHAGLALKTALTEELTALGFAVLDLGTESTASVDYPDYGYRMAAALADGKAARGVLVCGSGIGISMAANRYSWVRAALCHDVTSARLCREHNDANVIAFGERLIGIEVAKEALRMFLNTPFAGDRHVRRVTKLGTPPDKPSVA